MNKPVIVSEEALVAPVVVPNLTAPAAAKAAASSNSKTKAKAKANAETTTRTTAIAAATPSGHGPHPVHAAISDPSRWWLYEAALDPELVVIIPAMEGESGLDAAGPLPLAEEPRFTQANSTFLEHLRQQGQRLGQLAMATAMAAGASDNGNLCK